MQPIKRLARILNELSSRDNALFTLQDLRAALPEQSGGAFRVLLNRAVKSGLLTRVCRGIYFFPHPSCDKGLLLYHTAAKLRAHMFNYISLESVLSDAGVISQIPLNWITILSSGRSSTITCGEYGTIEFIHTERTPEGLMESLTFDHRCRLWRASPALALSDMKRMRRAIDLVDLEALNELI